jgi:hypothetical protein
MIVCKSVDRLSEKASKCLVIELEQKGAECVARNEHG